MNQLVAVSPSETALSRLLEMLTYRRPARSTTEDEFIARFLVPTGAYPDHYGNHWLTIGKSKVLWSSHTDTVHATPGLQNVGVKEGIASASKASCLGADCTVGVWLMLEMIAAGVPGCYVFHRDEEIGGRGSDYVAREYPDVLAHYDFAIAFDRRGTDSIITHQGGRRGASDAFAESIRPLLPPGYAPDTEGIFTDTANYVEHIAECTNLSVGYLNEHTPHESLDLAHAIVLRDAMVRFDESKLIAARDKSREEYDDSHWNWLDYLPRKTKGITTSTLEDYRDLLDFCRKQPDAVADFLEAEGITLRDLQQWSGC